MTETMRTDVTVPDQRNTIIIEFAPLSDDQRAFVDLHSLRAVGTELPTVDTDGVVIEFWLRAGDAAQDSYDDIRGWAIGNSLPIRRMIEP